MTAPWAQRFFSFNSDLHVQVCSNLKIWAHFSLRSDLKFPSSDDRAIAISSSASEIEKMKNQQSAYSWYAENFASHSVDASSVISTYTNITEGKAPDNAPATSYIPPNQKSINLAGMEITNVINS